LVSLVCNHRFNKRLPPKKASFVLQLFTWKSIIPSDG
jgi:hypothetical protein